MTHSKNNNAGIVFPPVFFANYQVKGLTRKQIDELLSNGWFRNDLHVQATQCRFVESSWRPCVMLRIPLANFQWKKRLRKVMRRNNTNFTCKIRPFAPREEMEELWQRFKQQVHQWNLVPSLARHLFRDVNPERFHTWEISVYENDKLIAFSLFDRGLESIASLEAAYDPDYARFSLGLFTMLLERSTRGSRFIIRAFIPRISPCSITNFALVMRNFSG